MRDERTDEEIIEIYKSGDREIFKELIARYTSPIFNFTAHLVGKNEATDITQEVFIKVWKNLKKFDPRKASFKTWLFTIAKNTSIDFLKKKRALLFSDLENEKLPDFSENIPDDKLLPDELLQKLQDSDLLNKTLEKLREDHRTVLILRYQEDMTFEEIGKVLGKPLNTVKSYHRRAILELRKMIL